LCRIDSVRNIRRHNQQLSGGCLDILSTKGKDAFTVHHLHHGVIRRGMLAEPTPPASPPAEPNIPPVEPPVEPPAEPNVVFKIIDANELQEITLNTGESICLYLAKQTFEEDVFVISLEVNISDPNFGWIDNTEYNPTDPNSSGTAQILASPRMSFFDYYGPGYTQFEGIQFTMVNIGQAISDGSVASFVYTATGPGDVVLTLINYDAVPARLEQIVIHQTDAESYSSSYSSQMGVSTLNSLMEIDSAAEGKT